VPLRIGLVRIVKEAIKRIKTQIAVGVMLSGVAGLVAYVLEVREIKAASERLIAAQVGEIEERLSLANAELDSVTSFVAQAGPDVAPVNNFISGLPLSRLGNVPWLWSAVVPAAEIDDFVRTVRAQPSMGTFVFSGKKGIGAALAPIILVAGSLDAGRVGSDLSDDPAVAELAALAVTANPGAPRGRLLRITTDGFPKDAVFMARIITLPNAKSRGIAWPSIVLRGLTVSNLLRSAQLADGQSLRLLDETKGPAGTLLMAGSSPGTATWLPTVTLPVGDYRFGLSLSPLPVRTRAGWWLPLLVSGLLATGLYAALRSGTIVGQRASQLGSVLSSTELRLAETERREVAFFENTGTANCETDYTTGKLRRVNESLCTLLGYDREELIGRPFSDITHPDDIGLSRSVLVDDLGQPKPHIQFEKRYLRKDGTIVWGLVNSKLYYDGSGQPSSYMTVIINISDRKQDETTRALLTRELAHRVRNTVQLTSSLARQTATTARSVKDYDLKFHRRLAALSAAQDILFDRNWMSAPLSRIAQATFRPFLPDDHKIGDLAVDLPNVEMPTQQAQTIAIALHELASNSSRFGALSNGGTVSVIGTVLNESDDSQTLHIRWDEQSTRAIRKPKRAGFGTRMLMSAMPEQFSGRASANWRSTGLLYEAWLKLPKTEA
jgi:PAS domain S-box-containing protein